MQFLEKFFKLKENKTKVSTEVLAGVTTFVTMVYILAVNPSILGGAFLNAFDVEAGAASGGLFTATALMCVIGTLIMSLYAKYPFALAPGMGLNAFFAYVVVDRVGWYAGLFLLLIQGIMFVALALFKFREKIFESIPKNLKLAIGVGIGLFITHIGLQNAGFIVPHPATLVTLGNMHDIGTILFMVGLVVTALLIVKKVRGGLFIGILATYALGIIAQLVGLYEAGVDGHSLIPSAIVSMPPSLADVNLITNFDRVSFADVSWFVITTLILILLIVEALDTVGTLIGVSEKADGMLDENGKLAGAGRGAGPALLSDAITTGLGALAGTSTTTTYIESASGVQAGGRTGLTSLTTAALFFVAMFFSPIFLTIPAFATAPALVIVGVYMVGIVTKIDFENDFSEAVPAFIVMILMPLTYSISDGVVFGVIAYVALKVLMGKAKSVSPMMYFLAAIFLLKVIFTEYY